MTTILVKLLAMTEIVVIEFLSITSFIDLKNHFLTQLEVKI